MKKFDVLVFSKNEALANTCSVYLCDNEPSPSEMLSIAKSSNESEVAFVIREEHEYFLRIFCATQEMKSCLHATLAASYLFHKKLKTGFEQQLHFLGNPIHSYLNRDLLRLTVNMLASEEIFASTSSNAHSLLSGVTSTWLAETASGRFRLMVQMNDVQAVKNVNADGVGEIAESSTDIESYFIYAENQRGHSYYGRMMAPRLGIKEDPINGNSCIALFSKLYHDDNTTVSINVTQNINSILSISKKGEELVIEAECYLMTEDTRS